MKSNAPEERRRFVRALEGFAREHALPPETLQAADLALEEHLSNILTYGYEDPRAVEIVIRLAVENRQLRVEVQDGGRAFDPTRQPPPDLTVPPEQRPIGGFGIHFMQQFMDSLEYRREAGRNVLVMGKSAVPAPRREQG